MQFGERHSQLLPFCAYMFAPGKSPVEVQPEIHDILLRKVYAVYVDSRAGFSSCGECVNCFVKIACSNAISMPSVYE
jgi:hypothetical protein